MKKGSKSAKAVVRSKSKGIVSKVRVERADAEQKSPKKVKVVEVRSGKKGDIFSGRMDKEGFEPEKDEFLEDEEHPWSHEAQELRMHLGQAEADVYSPEGREELTEEEGEIAPWEEGFMEGAEGRGGFAECASCEKLLRLKKEDVIERVIRGKRFWFCSEKCAKAGRKS